MKTHRWIAALVGAVCLVAAACIPPETPGGGGGSSQAGKIDRSFAAGYGWEDVDIATGVGTADIVKGPPVVLDNGTIVGAFEVTNRPNQVTPQSFDYYSDAHMVAHRADGLVVGRAVLPIIELPDGSPGGSPLLPMAAAPGNKVVISSGGYDRADRRMVYRYDDVLEPDATFDTDGAVEIPATLGPWTVGHVLRIAADSQGRVLVVLAATSSVHGVLVARLTPSGDLDASFGTGGWLALPDARDTSWYSVDLDIDSADRPVVLYAGTGGTFGLRRIVRLTSAGEVDPGFTSLVESGIDFVPYSVTIDGTDRLVVSVMGGGGTRLERYTSTGELDLTFGGGDGKSATFTRGADDVRLQPNGRILVLMGWINEEKRAYMEVLEADGTRATTVGNDGLLELSGARVAADETRCFDYGACVFGAFALTAGGTRILLWEQQSVDQVVLVQLFAP